MVPRPRTYPPYPGLTSPSRSPEMAPVPSEGSAAEGAAPAPRAVPGVVSCSSCLGVAFHSADRRRHKKVRCPRCLVQAES